MKARVRVLKWYTAPDETLAVVARRMTLTELQEWVDRLPRNQARVLRAELKQRDPANARGTLWEHVYCKEGKDAPRAG